MLQTIEAGRRPPRAMLSQPMRIRPYDSHLPEEICVTQNVSRKGFCFETSLGHYFAGLYVAMTELTAPRSWSSMVPDRSRLLHFNKQNCTALASEPLFP
jgi:hypothetical protein